MLATDIIHHFRIQAPIEKILSAISTREGLNAWWTEDSEADPQLDGKYTFYFAEHSIAWKAVVSKYEPGSQFEWRITEADEDWTGCLIGFTFSTSEDYTNIHFYHTGWPRINDHFHVTNYCWAIYLRLLKRYVERGEIVPYPERSEY